MFVAVAGSSAGKTTDVGVDSGPKGGFEGSRTSSDNLDRDEIAVNLFGGGRVFVASGVTGSIVAETILGAVVSIRKAWSNCDESPASGGASGCPIATIRTRWNPSGRNLGFAGSGRMKFPPASVVTVTSGMATAGLVEV